MRFSHGRILAGHPLSFFDTAYDEGYFSLRRMRGVMRQQFSGSATTEFFELLGELARHANRPLGHNLRAGRKRFQDSIRRLEEYRRSVAFGCRAQRAFALAAFHWQKTAETKRFHAQPRADQ